MIDLSLELVYDEKQVTPLFDYKCPKDSSHPLTLYYSKFGKLDLKYKFLIRDYPENGCEHDLRQERNELKGGAESTFGCIATQYFCHQCKLSFCGKCANEARTKNKIDSDGDSQPQGIATPVEGAVLFRN